MERKLVGAPECVPVPGGRASLLKARGLRQPAKIGESGEDDGPFADLCPNRNSVGLSDKFRFAGKNPSVLAKLRGTLGSQPQNRTG